MPLVESAADRLVSVGRWVEFDMAYLLELHDFCLARHRTYA
jgi:hypothetical protein